MGATDMDILERRAHGWDVILYGLSCCEIYCVNKSAQAHALTRELRQCSRRTQTQRCWIATIHANP